MSGERSSSGDESRPSSKASTVGTTNSSVRKWVRFDDTAGPETVIDENFEEQNKYDSSGSATVVQEKPAVQSPRRFPPVGKERNFAEDVAQIDVKLEETVPSPRVALASSASRIARNAADIRSSTNANGKIISTVLPVNKSCTWLSPATFDPNRVPKCFMDRSLTLPVEDFCTAMQMLTNDFRFRLYTVIYRRLIVSWLIFSLFILIVILVSGMRGLILFGVTLIWLFLTGLGVLGCLYVKRTINENLHRCVASVNKLLMPFNLLVGMEDRGKMSCHKIAIPFIYFDVSHCVPKIVQQLNLYESQNGSTRNLPSISLSVEPGANGRNLSQEEKAELIILKYSQSYVKALARHTIRFPSRPSEGTAEFTPLHCSHSFCLCQYVQKNHFEKKPRGCCAGFIFTSEMPPDSFYPGLHPGGMP